MSTYEERMAEKYGFFSKDDVPLNKKINQDSADIQEETPYRRENTYKRNI
jgi:hypothetical protein